MWGKKPKGELRGQWQYTMDEKKISDIPRMQWQDFLADP